MISSRLGAAVRSVLTKPAPTAGAQAGVADREAGQAFTRAAPPRVDPPPEEADRPEGGDAPMDREPDREPEGPRAAPGPVRERPRGLGELAITRLLAWIPLTRRPWRSESGVVAYRRADSARVKSPFRKGSLVDRRAA